MFGSLPERPTSSPSKKYTPGEFYTSGEVELDGAVSRPLAEVQLNCAGPWVEQPNHIRSTARFALAGPCKDPEDFAPPDLRAELAARRSSVIVALRGSPGDLPLSAVVVSVDGADVLLSVRDPIAASAAVAATPRRTRQEKSPPRRRACCSSGCRYEHAGRCNASHPTGQHY